MVLILMLITATKLNSVLRYLAEMSVQEFTQASRRKKKKGTKKGGMPQLAKKSVNLIRRSVVMIGGDGGRGAEVDGVESVGLMVVIL